MLVKSVVAIGSLIASAVLGLSNIQPISVNHGSIDSGLELLADTIPTGYKVYQDWSEMPWEDTTSPTVPTSTIPGAIIEKELESRRVCTTELGERRLSYQVLTRGHIPKHSQLA